MNELINEISITSIAKMPLFSLTIENGVEFKSERYNREFLVKNKESAYKVIRPGDFVINPMNLRFGAIALNKTGIEGSISKYYNVFRFNDKSNIAFFDYFLTSKRMLPNYERISLGGLNEKKRVHFSHFLKLRISIPTLPEQTKIANFLSAVDGRIQQVSQTHALLNQYKKGVMQKIFSQELRFKDENGKAFGAWEIRCIKEILTIGSGRDYKHLNNGNIPVYGTGGLMTTVDNFLYEGETVCIGRKGTIDKPFFHSGKIWTVDTLFYTHRFIDILPKFLYQLFLTINWKEHNEASGVPSLSKSTIESIIVNIPTLPEQTKIANFLSAIDDKINQAQSQLSALQEYKRGLLQQMFI
ncbi:MAG: restriction endonuclease subunit S [Yersinia sp. (in: enterobacteria)]